ncbi:MAG: hypothetical protein QM765_03175 [Myxococcales bacterium]
MRALLSLWASVPLALALAGCQTVASSRVTAGDDEMKEQSAGTPEQQLLKRIALAKKHHCDDRPSEISEGYAARAREKWQELSNQCSSTRCWRALRELDECIASHESEPNQVDDETRARREAAKATAQELRGDSVFQIVLKKKRMAVDEADSAAEDFRSAKKDGVTGNELQVPQGILGQRREGRARGGGQPGQRAQGQGHRPKGRAGARALVALSLRGLLRVEGRVPPLRSRQGVWKLEHGPFVNEAGRVQAHVRCEPLVQGWTGKSVVTLLPPDGRLTAATAGEPGMRGSLPTSSPSS